VFGVFRRLVKMLSTEDGIPGGLTGVYDLHDDKIFGWVDKIPYATSGGVDVEVSRRGSVVAASRTERETDGGRLPFTLALDGRFTESELAHETVIVTARSGRGDTGTLKLEGTTQLMLVRAHLGVPVEKILDLDFSSHGNARRWLGQGWSGSEARFTWTLDDDSFVHFVSPASTGPYLLRLVFGACVMPLVPVQKLDIFLNDVLVAALIVNEDKEGFHEIPVDAGLFARSAASTLRLHHPHAARPSDHFDTGDNRRLAFNFRALSLVRVLPSGS
jgi:hypothetical protein